MEAMKEELELFFVCWILDIVLLNRSKCRSLFIQHCGYIQKSKENCRQTGNTLEEISCLVRSICVYFGSEETRKIENQASKFTEMK